MPEADGAGDGGVERLKALHFDFNPVIAGFNQLLAQTLAFVADA